LLLIKKLACEVDLIRRSNVRVHVIVHINVYINGCMFMLHVQSRLMSMSRPNVHVHAACSCPSCLSMSALDVLSPCCISILHQHAAWTQTHKHEHIHGHGHGHGYTHGHGHGYWQRNGHDLDKVTDLDMETDMDTDMEPDMDTDIVTVMNTAWRRTWKRAPGMDMDIGLKTCTRL
jgi:hypothetical protein